MKRQKHLHLHMTDLFTCPKDIASCPWTKQSHLGKCSNEKLHPSTLVNGGTLRSTADDFASALSNVNNVELSDLLEFLVMLLFSSLCSCPKIICSGLIRLWTNPWGRFVFDNLKKISGRSFCPFSPANLQKYTRMVTYL